MRGTSSRLARAIALVFVLLLVAGVGIRWGVGKRAMRPAQSPQGRPTSRPSRAVPLALLSPDRPSAGAANDAPPERDPLAGLEDPQSAWASVDLNAIRAAMPDNLYWKMAVPTQDPEVLRKRGEERERWNIEYGKVLSNTATDEEIDAYYGERQRLSEDYLEFIVYLLTNYGYQIPRRDVAALKLAAEMHNARLEEIPRQIAEAHERRKAHDAARRAWLKEQEAFDGGTPGAR
jgi:hypothetical protein